MSHAWGRPSPAAAIASTKLATSPARSLDAASAPGSSSDATSRATTSARPPSTTASTRPRTMSSAALAGPASTLNACRTSRAMTSKSDPPGEARPRTTCQPWAASESAKASRSRVLPTPGGATTRTRPGSPPFASAAAACSRSSSASRPSIGALRRPIASSRDGSGCRPRTREAGTGFVFPLSASGSTASSSTAWATDSAVRSPTSTPPGSAAVWSRAATFTVSPLTRPASGPPVATRTSPVLTPTRSRSCSASSPRRAPRSPTAWTSASPAWIARTASSSSTRGVPNTAIAASPMNFSSDPRYRPTMSRTVAKYASWIVARSSGSRPSASVVNPTRSANSTETIRRSDVLADATGAGRSTGGCYADRVARLRQARARRPGPTGRPPDRPWNAASRAPRPARRAAAQSPSA